MLDKHFFLSIADLVIFKQFQNDREFVKNIQSNTTRYIHHFETEADKLMPAPTIQLRESDVIDVLEVSALCSVLLLK